ncbi:CCCH tandem zinc finger protein [Schizosaccharomyces japonicus yFS275]|uniref:CCCH tandem zinc finger protein n=1 Tax=Schizosaccharomyces japonicus (strain yFS275 / FY16936) TaxID=402676 RepID=B6K7H1_SCHJY|nr:CCCH tandem zinc finger protein [Schizosaccharomyces japonicus yFS275]EEB09475.1 CCCH tandem zinc finger protein [Schizosaccharomyces japonicus yFS275]
MQSFERFGEPLLEQSRFSSMNPLLDLSRPHLGAHSSLRNGFPQLLQTQLPSTAVNANANVTSPSSASTFSSERMMYGSNLLFGDAPMEDGENNFAPSSSIGDSCTRLTPLASNISPTSPNKTSSKLFPVDVNHAPALFRSSNALQAPWQPTTATSPTAATTASSVVGSVAPPRPTSEPAYPSLLKDLLPAEDLEQDELTSSSFSTASTPAITSHRNMPRVLSSDALRNATNSSTSWLPFGGNGNTFLKAAHRSASSSDLRHAGNMNFEMGPLFPFDVPRNAFSQVSSKPKITVNTMGSSFSSAATFGTAEERGISPSTNSTTTPLYRVRHRPSLSQPLPSMDSLHLSLGSIARPNARMAATAPNSATNSGPCSPTSATAASVNVSGPQALPMLPPSQQLSPSSERSSASSTVSGKSNGDGPVIKNNLYKTEPCKNWMAYGRCRYGSKCQFAHGPMELKTPVRHPKYKSRPCRSYSQFGYCPYGQRCCFLHATDLV